MISLDIKDAYYSIPIAPEQQKFFFEVHLERDPVSIFVPTYGGWRRLPEYLQTL